MVEDLDPRGAANVFTGQMMALIALGQALVECGAVKSEALIASLERQMKKYENDGVDAPLAVPLAALIRTLRFEARPKPH